MNVVLMSQEKTEVKISFEVSAEGLEEGIKFAYNKNKNKISVPGFRKGKVPRKLIEAQYGESFFYEDAINHIFPEAYTEAIEELKLEVVSAPTLDVEYIEKEKGVKFVVDVTVKPEITLGQYKELSIEKVNVEVTEEDITAELEKIQMKNARTVEVTDRKAEMGDTIKLSYLGSVDGVPFEGGQSDEHDLELGSNMFIPGFEEQVVGHELGEKFDISVTFPTEYHAPDLAGKDAIFAIEIKKISTKQMPELNDEFAEDVSEFSTMAEYKESLAKSLKEDKEGKAKIEEHEKLLDIAIANATMEVPEIMYNNRIDQMMKEFEQNISRQGLNMEIYCQYLGTSIAEMRENFKETATKSVDARLVLEQVAKEEKLSISEEDLDKEIGKYAESYGIDAEMMKQMMQADDKKAIENDMLVRAAAEILDNTVVYA